MNKATLNLKENKPTKSLAKYGQDEHTNSQIRLINNSKHSSLKEFDNNVYTQLMTFQNQMKKQQEQQNNPVVCPKVFVHTRNQTQDILNAFDRNPDAGAEFVGMVMKGKDFHARDSAAAPLAARLANIIPGLIRPHRSNFSSRSPSGIHWVEAGK